MMLVALITNAQLNQIQNNNIEPCGFDQIHNELLNSDPSYRLKTEQFNDFAKNFSISTMKSGSVLRVPVVVHVMHKGEAVGSGSNISEADINQGILQLNERFRKIPGSLGDGNGVDVEIEFALAIRDPNGNCTNGIVRYNMSGQSAYMNYGVNRDNTNGIEDGDLKALSRWNTNQYYNIYLVSEIDDNECGYGIQGYAYFASAHGQSYDGMVQLGCKFAQSGNTTLTHELGHALNLYHTFEGDANGTSCPSNTSCSTQGDRVCDIPPHIRSASDCVAGTNSCDGGSSKELFIHNYMDYSSDACQSEFTAGQKTRAVAALTTNRASYLESNGNMSLVPPASAGVDFSASNQVVCLGSPVSFYDESTCIPNTYQNGGWSGISFSWTFDNGVDAPVTSTLQNPTITFANAGSYTVTLQVTNGHGTTSLTKPNFVVVASGNPTAACIPTSQNPSGNYGYAMSNFTFNTINNTTSSVANGEYVDYTCQYATNVVAGNAYDIKVTLNNQATYSEDVKVYIDYNDNGVFAAGELVMSATRPAGTGSSTFTQNITIPLTAVTGKVLRVRAIADANGVTGSCDNNFVGDVEDYGVYISSSACTPPAVTSHPVNRTICQSTNTTFVVAATDAVSYQWQVNTGSGFNNISNGGVYSGATLATLTITGATVGMNGNTYRCIVTGACEPTATSNSASLTVNATNTASVASSTPSLCINTLMTNITHATTGVTGIGSPTNLPTGVSAGFTSNTITISGTPNVAGTYNYSIPLTGGCGTVNATGTITVNPIPSNAGSIAGSVSECDNSTGVAYSISSVSGATGYTWTVPSGATIASGQGTTNITVDFGTTSGNVAVTPTNSCGNGGQATKAVTIAPCGSAPVADFTANTTTVCLGESVDFTDLSSNSPTSWLWNFGDGGSSSSQNTTYTYNTPGTYTVTLTVTNVSGSDDEEKTNLIVVSETSGIILDTARIRDYDCGRVLTEATQVVYSTIVADATGYEFEVTNSGGSQFFSYTTPSWYNARYIRLMDIPGIQIGTTYNVRVKAKKGQCDIGYYGESCTITTPSNPVPNTQVIPTQCGTTLSSMSTVVYANHISGSTSYIFEVSNTDLSYSVTKTAWAGGRAIKLSEFPGIIANTTYNIRVKAVLGGNTGNFGATCQITTPSQTMIQNETARFIGEEVVEEEKLPTTLSIYPNPNSGEQLNVMMDNLTPNTTLIITDIYGKVILNKPLNTELSQYNVEVKFENKLTSGFYFITLVSEENKITEKLIVR